MFIKFFLKLSSSLLLLTFLSLIYFILNVLDGHSTYRVVSVGSYKSEKNPLARFFIKKLGALKGIIFIKLLSLAVVYVMLFKYAKYFTKDFNLIFFIADAFYTWVVIHNYKNLFKMIDRQERLYKKIQNVL